MNLGCRTLQKPKVIGRFVPTRIVAIDSRVLVVRIEHFFTERVAAALARQLQNYVYEPDLIADRKRVARAARSGDLPDDPLVRIAGAKDAPEADAAMQALTGPWVIAWLEQRGSRLRALRPPTPYRMGPGDFITPHDDCPAPEYRVSLAYNLTRGWQPGDGGETEVGLVDTVEEFEHPDFPLPVKKWTFRDGTYLLPPVFNSALVLLLSEQHAHAVVSLRRGFRYSITTLYGTRETS